MNEQFMKLPVEKREQILNAALMEFAHNGFEQASTNHIVKQAGIGKGMLFYYFNSKKELYDDLYTYSFDVLQNHYLKKIDTEIDDFIERVKESTKLKLEYLHAYPEVNHFLARFFFIEHKELPDHLQLKYQEILRSGDQKLFEGVNLSNFREDIDPQRALKIIEWTIKGYQQEMLSRFQGKRLEEIDLKPLWDEFDHYLDIIKKVYFK